MMALVDLEEGVVEESKKKLLFFQLEVSIDSRNGIRRYRVFIS